MFTSSPAPLPSSSPGGWSCCGDDDDVLFANVGGGCDDGGMEGINSTRLLKDSYRKVKTLRRGAQGVVYLATPKGGNDDSNTVVAVKRIFPISVSHGLCSGITDVSRREIGVLRYLNTVATHATAACCHNDVRYLGEDCNNISSSPFVELVDVVLAVRGKTAAIEVPEAVIVDEVDMGDSPPLCGPPYGGGLVGGGDEVCLVMEYCPMDLSSEEGLVGRCKKPVLLPANGVGGPVVVPPPQRPIFGLGLGVDDDDDEGDDSSGCYIPKQDNSRRALNLGLPPNPHVALSLRDDGSSDDDDVVDFAAKFAANGCDYEEGDDEEDCGVGLEIKSSLPTANDVTSGGAGLGVCVADELLVRQAVVRALLYQVLRGVFVMHRHHILHRDIKGSNILLTTNNGDEPRVRFADFGSARSLCSSSGPIPVLPSPKDDKEGNDDDRVEHPTLTSAVTRTTLLYRSPETLMNTRSGGAEYSYPSDMWAVGVVFAELLLSVVKPCLAVDFTTPSTAPRWGGNGGGINAHYLFQVQSEMELIGAIYKLIGPPDASTTSFLLEDGEPTSPPPPTPSYPFPTIPPSLANETATIGVKFARLTSTKGLHLLASLLTMDPKDRISAGDALDHPYFDEPCGSISGGGCEGEEGVDGVDALAKAKALLASWCDANRKGAVTS